MTARDELEEYLRSDPVLIGTEALPDLPTHRAIVRRLLPERLATKARELGTDAVRPLQRRAVGRAKKRQPLYVHIGSGRVPKKGWVNVDLLGASVEIAWNIRRGLPFDDGAADVVFHEHVLEHFPLREGCALLEECHRVLRPGGVLRIVVPDVGRYMTSYANGTEFIDAIRPHRPTRLLAVSEIVYWYGHRAMYDFETLSLLCRAAGFASVVQSEYGGGRVQPSPDSEHHMLDSLYVEVSK